METTEEKIRLLDEKGPLYLFFLFTPVKFFAHYIYNSW